MSTLSRPSPFRFAIALSASLALLASCQDDQRGEGVARAQAAGRATGPAEAPSPGSGGGSDRAPANPPRGPEHAVFSLNDNRLLAHAQRGGGLVVLAGSAGFAKYLRFAKPKLTWKLGEKLDGRRVALADAYAVVEVPLTEEQARAGKLWIRVHSPAPRRLSVNPNDKPGTTVELVAGWQTAEVALPPGLLAPGENKLQLVFSKGQSPAVEWIQVGGEAPDASGTAPTIWDATTQALVLPRGGGLAYYVQVPKSGRLVGDVVGAGCAVKVRARAHAGTPIEGTLRGAGAAMDLAPLAGRIVRLELLGEGCPEARLARGALAVPGETPQVHRPKKPRYIVLWIMDSLRADRVKPFFPQARAEVPVFESLVDKAAIFRHAYVQGNESRASHASIWSAVYVALHRMIPGGNKVLEARWKTLGDTMKEAGLFTSGVSGNGYITAKWGFGKGWDAYRNHIHDGGGVRGEDILKFALASVEGKKEPWFLYIGTIDTHVSWRAKEPWFSKYDPKPYSGRYVKEASGKDVELMATGKLKITDRDKERIVAIYDSNVSYQDDLLGKLIAKLTEWGILEDTMIVVTADHGDEQWEDGRVGHGASVRESLVRVPLLIYYPPLFPAGIIEEGVDTIDILPTLRDALGLPPIPEAQGESLIPLAQGVGRGYPRPSITSQYELYHAMRLAGWKVRVGGAGSPNLYHVDEDPWEKKDLAAERPIERRMLTDAFSTFLVYQRDWKKARWGVASNHSPQLAADLEK